MARLRIVGINYAPESTGIAPYTTGLAEHLAAAGHEVAVVTGLPHYPAWRIAPGYGGRMSREETQGGVRVRRRAHYVPTTPSATHRAVYEGTFLASALPAASERGVDAVIGIVPSLSGGILARLAASRNRVPYGLLFQDLMGPAAAQSGLTGGGRVAGLTRVAESWAVAEATAVAVVSDGFRPYLRDLGVPDERIHLVPNWTHIESSTADRDVTRHELGWDDGRQVVLHAGNMGAKQGLEQVVDAARLADERGDRVRFVLMGAGNQRAALEALGVGIASLDFARPADERHFPDVLAAADVLLLSERASVVDMSLPSKVTSYATAGRPIVAAVPDGGTTATELDRSGAAIRVEPGDPAALLDALARLRGDPDLVVRLGEAGPAYVTRYLRRDAALPRADAFIDAVLERG
jgi:glycosyltransferase involved in cell wall biosynthesis